MKEEVIIKNNIDTSADSNIKGMGLQKLRATERLLEAIILEKQGIYCTIEYVDDVIEMDFSKENTCIQTEQNKNYKSAFSINSDEVKNSLRIFLDTWRRVEYDENMKNYVNIVTKPFKYEQIKIGENEYEDKLAKLALKCQFCEKPSCEKVCKNNVPIRDINRRLAVGNFYGAKNLLKNYDINPCLNCESKDCENKCIRKGFAKEVSIREINSKL